VSLPFQILATAAAGRRGVMDLPHRQVQTPVFMPVGTAGSVKAVPQHLLEALGTQIILGNTYHLYLRPGHEVVRRMGGLHRFMSWPRGMLTDSGGFQVFSLNELRKVSADGVEFRSHLDGSTHQFTPERSIEIQIALGADILMVFDECTEYPADRERARQSMELTVRWAEKCKKYFGEHGHEVPWAQGAGQKAELKASLVDGRWSQEKTTALPIADGRGGPALFAIVQGGMYPELRKECAQRLVEMDFPGYAIGGLSVGEPRSLTRDIVESTLEHLPQDKPRYLMGVGTPEEIVEYAGLGVDMMDCVHPTRAARHGLLLTSEGKINIKGARYAADQGALDPSCCCRVCSRYSRAYLRHLFATHEVLGQVLNSTHNLAYYLDTMKQVRHSILLGEFTGFLSGFRSQNRKSPARAQSVGPTIAPTRE
jgi:queuine tRNA-ribosyltransferase